MTLPAWLGPPLRRHELRVLAAIIVVAFAARAWQLSDVSLNHYDEGVYAFTAWGLADADRPIHPEQRNSPIGLAFLSSLVMRAVGPTDRAPIVVNVLLGTLSVAALWAVTRRWFGGAAGVAAAALLACSEFHVAMSRSGMTDVLFALLFMCGLPIAGRALRAPGRAATLGAALATAAAWNTKYHGWLTTAVATAGLVPWAAFNRWRPRDYAGAAWRLTLITVIATACYLPWFLFAARQAGGFSQLAAYQWSFLDPHFSTNALRQVRNLLYFDGALTRASMPAALAAVALLEPGAVTMPLLLVVTASAVIGFAVGGTIWLWLLTAAAIPLLMRSRDSGAWLLLAWGASFLSLVPVYNPYARTTLPLVVAFCAASGYVLARVVARLASTAAADSASAWKATGCVAAVVLVVAAGISRHDTARWRRSRDLPDAAIKIREAVGPGAKVIVIGESTLAFYLELQGVRAFRGFEYWETVVAEHEPVYVVTGIYIQRAPTLRKNYALLKDRLTLLAEYPFFPYDSRLLETFRPVDALALLAERRADYTVRLFRYTPDPSGRVPELVKF